MNFNNLKERLEKTLLSLTARYDNDVKGGVNITFTHKSTLGVMSVTFGKDSAEEIANKIFLILYNLSSLKDHLKNCLKNNGYDPNIIETEINNSLHLQILIDLVNQEKHGYPLTKTNRSAKNPIIKNACQVLQNAKNSPPGSSFSFTVGSNGLIEQEGNMTISIDADIYDDKGVLLFKLDELIDACFNKWDQIIKTYNCY
jgi:hypothetical protein